MAVSSEYVAYIQDLLCELAELTTKPFFGGILERAQEGLVTAFRIK